MSVKDEVGGGVLEDSCSAERFGELKHLVGEFLGRLRADPVAGVEPHGLELDHFRQGVDLGMAVREVAASAGKQCQHRATCRPVGVDNAQANEGLLLGV